MCIVCWVVLSSSSQHAITHIFISCMMYFIDFYFKCRIEKAFSRFYSHRNCNGFYSLLMPTCMNMIDLIFISKEFWFVKDSLKYFVEFLSHFRCKLIWFSSDVKWRWFSVGCINVNEFNVWKLELSVEIFRYMWKFCI